MLHFLKKYLVTCSLLPAALLFAQTSLDVNRVLAIVDDTVITALDVQEKVAHEVKQLQQLYSGKELEKHLTRLGEETLNAMINRELLYMDFKELKANIPSHLIQSRIDQAISSATAGDAIKFEEALYAQGMTMAELREKLLKDLATELLLRNKVKMGISIPDRDIQAYYDKHKLTMIKPNRYHLAILMLKKDGKNAKHFDQTIADIQQAIKNKTPFDRLVKKYSDAPNAPQGGDLGWLESPAPALLKAVKELDKGETTATPFTIGSHTYFAKVIDKNGGGIPFLDEELKNTIRQRLIRAEESKRYKEYMKELQMKYPVRRLVPIQASDIVTH